MIKTSKAWEDTDTELSFINGEIVRLHDDREKFGVKEKSGPKKFTPEQELEMKILRARCVQLTYIRIDILRSLK